MAISERLVAILLGKRTHEAPRVNGLLNHPAVLPSGEILNTPGLHESSRLYVASAATVPGVRPFGRDEAHAALQWLRATVLDGFEFASVQDADTALAGLFTGVQRRLLPMAPGLAVLASVQSSGKTSLARVIHGVMTGRDLPVCSLALKNEDEVRKALAGMLARNPAAICFDNLPDGATLTSATLATAMTSPEMVERKLGSNDLADLNTCVLMMATGNNLTLGPDEVSRWLVSRLEPRTARPQERKFRHADVHAHAAAIRPDALCHVVGIIAGCLASGGHTAPTTSRFTAWDRMVGGPLHWAGGSDVATGFQANVAEAPEEQALGALALALSSTYNGREFAAGDLAKLAFQSEALRDALEVLGVQTLSGKPVSALLKKKSGRPVELHGQTVRIRHRDDTHAKRPLFRLEICG